MDELEKVDREMETEGVWVMWMREPSHEHTCATTASREEEEKEVEEESVGCIWSDPRKVQSRRVMEKSCGGER
jgi:hypothetical protein